MTDSRPTPDGPRLPPRADLTATLLDRENLSADAQLLRFESKTPLQILPGQFTMVRVPGGGLLRRPYSFCDHLENGAFTLLVKEVGVGTRALMKLPLGGTVSSLGPLGTTFDPPPSDRTPVIVAGGVGIAPFVLFCRRLAESGRRGIVLLGGRRRPDLYLWDTFERFGMDVRVASEDGRHRSARRRPRGRGPAHSLLLRAYRDVGEGCRARHGSRRSPSGLDRTADGLRDGLLPGLRRLGATRFRRPRGISAELHRGSRLRRRDN